MYPNAEVASGPWSSCVDAADYFPQFSRGGPSPIVSVWTSFIRWLVLVFSVLDSARVEVRVRHSSREAGTTPGETGRDVSAGVPVMPDDDDPVSPDVDALVNPDVDAPMIPDAPAPTIPDADAPMTPDVDDPMIPGDAASGSR